MKKTKPSHLAATLRKLRCQAGLSQGDLAGRTGLSQGSISLMETGRIVPRVVTLGRLARGLGVAGIEIPAG